MPIARHATHALAACAAAVLTASSAASTLSTNFFGGAVGAQPSPSNGISQDLADITDFGVANRGVLPQAFDGTTNLGEIVFVNNGSFYAGGNRAYGFAGQGRSDITFAPSTVASVTLQVRGSDGQNAGGNSLTVTPGALGTSDVTLLIWSNAGFQSVVTDISNDAFQSISLDVETVPGDFISRISLINNSTDGRSVAFIGSLEATLIPEPSAALLTASSAGALLLRRRRRA